MKLLGPSRYNLTFDPHEFSILCAEGTPRFSGLATTSLPKLYVVSVQDWPIYVGITRQSMRSRLRIGWTATGETGYHGYAWRHRFTEAVLDLWCHKDAKGPRPDLDVETVEAEVVFQIRATGQWPAFQTEIHFHASTQEHRDLARQIMARYRQPAQVPRRRR